MSSPEFGYTGDNVGQLDSLQILANQGIEIDPTTAGSLTAFVKAAVKSQPGCVGEQSAADFITQAGQIEAEFPLFSGRAFRYPAVSEIPEHELHCTAESTVLSATRNMVSMVKNYGPLTFAAKRSKRRRDRAVEWTSPLDDVFEIRARGASGASAFSIDLAVGMVDPTTPGTNYNELWRTGIDTERHDDVVGARFIRTGSGVKPNETHKKAAFDRFRKVHGIMPQRLLGLLGLYFMRELQPDYALALTTHGAKRISTLGRSSGRCSYDAIFANIGFEPSSDDHWQLIADFRHGFYEALDRSGINRNESQILHHAVSSLNQMEPIGERSAEAQPALFNLCSDATQETIAKELAVFMRA